MQLSSVNRRERSVAERLHAAAIRLLRRLRRQDAAMGLTAARASALSIMVFGGRVNIGQLAQAEQVSAPTMTRLVVGLERDGLVRRDSDPDDGRVVWLQATARGTRILHEGRRRRVEALAADLAALEPADRDLLGQEADILERVLADKGKGQKSEVRSQKSEVRSQKNGSRRVRTHGGRMNGSAR
jgi:DNA-binding MarR family transcriptional regulator